MTCAACARQIEPRRLLDEPARASHRPASGRRAVRHRVRVLRALAPPLARLPRLRLQRRTRGVSGVVVVEISVAYPPSRTDAAVDDVVAMSAIDDGDVGRGATMSISGWRMNGGIGE
jgi:hypothetical protein